MYNISFLGILGKTLIRAHTQRGLFKNLLNHHTSLHTANLSITSRENSTTKWKDFSPPGDVLHAVKDLLQSNSSVRSASIDLMSTSLWRHSGKSYSISSRHLGNSYIEYHINGKRGFGSIEHIVRLVSDSFPIFIVKSFLPLQPSDQIRNPYRLLPHLKADVMYEQTEQKCLSPKSLFGHCAAIKNPAGTFSINKPTVQLIGLRSMVSHDHYIPMK